MLFIARVQIFFVFSREFGCVELVKLIFCISRLIGVLDKSNRVRVEISLKAYLTNSVELLRSQCFRSTFFLQGYKYLSSYRESLGVLS
jgi:hypothetical protein